MGENGISSVKLLVRSLSCAAAMVPPGTCLGANDNHDSHPQTQLSGLRNALSIEVASPKNVSALQEAIQKQKQHAFKGVDADAPILWSVSIPVDVLLEGDPRIIGLIEDQFLSPLEELSEVFSSLPQSIYTSSCELRPQVSRPFSTLYVSSNRAKFCFCLF